MANFKSVSVFFFIFGLCLFPLGLLGVAANDDRKVYIVYMGSISDEYSISSNDHLNILNQVLQQGTAEESLIRSYRRSFNGFAAKLTEREIQHLKNMKEVISVFPSRTLELQTTRSWDFMGFPESAHKGHEKAESNIIVGVLDTGLWPESPSFQDEGFGPPPKKWKGVCKGGLNFTCNNKVIGARTYVTGSTARDENGHGSHTASTAAGIKVANTSFYGIASGSVRGGAPSARIAAYKVCDSTGCQESSIIAAFDDAIADGVDVITISVGGKPAEFEVDGIAIGAFHAMERGILTLQSAGNDGNLSGTVGSVAPWIFTVAASTMDRKIVDKLVLGNGKTLVGTSVNSFTLKGDKFPLVYGQAATSECDEESARYCVSSCLDESLVKGKIVVCDETTGVREALRVGALGVVALGSGREDVSFIVPMPAVTLSSNEYEALLSYINSTRHPVGKILKSEATNDTSAPVVASFSSRGPNGIASDILKPDITAPGVDILAAYSPIAPVTTQLRDKRSVLYSVLSGTSMSCPHVAGIAAYLKSVHPDWSPSALKSALMTTARLMSPSKNDDGEFAYGSGHVDPIRATNPGLVYETTREDYITFLCKSGYTSDQIRVISGDKTSSCPTKTTKTSSPKDVNYPSMSALVDATSDSYTFTFHRTVMNVGVANSTYEAKIETSNRTAMKVTVEPDSLSFTKLKEQKSFNVTVEGVAKKMTYYPTALVWSDGIHTVRSPIVVYRS